MRSQTNLPLFISDKSESAETEFKSAVHGILPRDIWKTISAFANTNGGRIIFGISEEGDMINLSRNEIDKLQLDLQSLCSNKFNVEITPDIEYKDGILSVYIPPSPGPLRPVYGKNQGSSNGTFVRSGSASVKANSEWVQRLTVAARGGAETLTYSEYSFEEVLDMELVKDFIKKLNDNKNNMYQSFTTIEVLIKQRILDRNGSLTLFGILALGKDEAAQEIIASTVKVSITRYPGIEKVNPDNIQETYIDSKEFTGNLVQQFDDAYSYLKSVLPIRGIVGTDGKRRDYLVVPDIALRESLANTLAHRDYATYSSNIQIDIYSDRIEFINPGESLVPIDQLDTAPSTTRNPLMMAFLKMYKITDQKARGIRTIKSSLREAGLKPPSFNNIGQSFMATLHLSAFISQADRKWLNQFKEFELNDRQLNALVFVRNNQNGISNSEYRSINSMTNVRDDKRANKELRDMVGKNILTVVGENRARRYILR